MGGKIQIPSHYLNGVSFSMFTSEEILKLSVKELINPHSFDQIGHPTIGGLYDPALGPTETYDECKTCGLAQQTCPGHMGHIKLPFVVFNPVFFKTLYQILRGTCFHCYQITAKRSTLHLMKCQLKALEYGLIYLVDELRDIVNDQKAQSGGERGIDENEVIQNLTDKLDSVLEGIQGKSEEDGKHRSQIKNVVEVRQKLVREFISGRYFQKSRCPNCLSPNRPLKTEHNNKIFFSSMSKKTISRIRQTLNTDHTLTKKVNRLKKGTEEDEEYEETGELVEIDELEQRLKEQNEKEVHKYEEQQILSPAEARRHLAKIWENDGELLGQIIGALQVNVSEGNFETDIFFTDCVPVPPTKYRPLVVMGDMRMEGGQTKNFAKVLECSNELKGLLRLIKESTDGEIPPETNLSLDESLKEGKKMHMDKVHYAWVRLQSAVNSIYDSNLDKLSTEKTNGIKQILEKKEGLFRKHMMGKRVNFAARSVISPDPYIDTNEIGIPEIFAKKLYYPQPVTHWNFTQLRQAVINGPEVHPGASFVIMENGSQVKLRADNRTQREAIAKQLLTPSTEADHTFGVKMVCRHLHNGDVLLLNRQPTLHRPSIQAHKARVLKGEKTLRLHYANCKAYNADFDGDEMNAHFPQDEVSRSEAYNIASTDVNYLVPKDGTPLAGLIQDHMVAGVRLTIRGRFFNRHDYQQLVFNALTNKAGNVIQLPPCIMKPQPMWSGKQVLSTVLLNIIPDGKARLNLDGKSKIAGKSFQSRRRKCTLRDYDVSWRKVMSEMDESHVVIQDGELLVGVLDKGHYGATAYGLVHCCYELYGGRVAGMLLTSLAKLFTCYLQLHGFSLGVEDILCTVQGDQKRREIMEEGAQCGNKTAAKALNLDPQVDEITLRNKLQEAHFLADGSGLKDLDLSMKGSTDDIQNKISNVLMPLGLLKSFPSNNLQLMVQSGAKGSTVNCMQISCLLGQIELEGRRPPLMMSGQSLPSFPAYETSPRAGGFVDGRFLTGIRPQEYFFHCMAGREGLVDTAVKTSRSGYLQRCIIKHLEGLTVAYDQSVRDSDGSIVQFEYGTDGLEVTKTQFLKKKQFPFLIQNQKAVASEVSDKLNRTKAPLLWRMHEKHKMKWQEQYGEKIAKCTQLHDKWYDKNGVGDLSHRTKGFDVFCKKKWKKVVSEKDNLKVGPTGRTEAQQTMCDLWRQQDEKKRAKYKKGALEMEMPVVSQIHPARNLGAVTEKFQSTVNEFIEENMGQMVREDDDEILKKSSNHISESKLRSLLYVNYMRSLVPPGEAVGLIAAQSIGEPSTQMTLNTFHFAGRGEMNVTLGIPRLREILMVASANIKTPAMDIPLIKSKKAKKRGTELKQKLNKVFLSQVLEDVEVVESLSVKNSTEKGRLYKIRFQFLPHETYKEEYCVTPSRILHYMETKFFLRMIKGIEVKMKALAKTSLMSYATLKYRVREKEEEVVIIAPGRVDDGDDLSGDEQHDDDAVARKARSKKDEENDYEGEDEEKEEVEEEESDEEGDDNYYGDDAEQIDDGDNPTGSRPASPTELSQKKSKKTKAPEMSQKRITSVRACIEGSVSYKYDTLEELWCEITIRLGLQDKKLDMASCIESIARSSVVYQVPSINRCFLSESKKPGEEGIWRLKTEGVNIHEMYNYNSILNLNQLYSNDIHGMAHNYGIEAACSVLIQEINDVFGNYGIQVDYRHLSLIADYMTFEGEYKAFNRIGLESNASPLQKMTFETTMHFLKTATITGARDDLKSPSSRLVTGQLVKGGTGAFHLMQKLNL